MAVGRVVKFDEARGFGFIAPADGSEDVFLHVNDLLMPESMVRPGVTVVFDVDEGDRGPKASNIQLQGDAAGAASVPGGAPAGRFAAAPGARDVTAEITELLLAVVPPLTGDQILAVRARLTGFAAERGWLNG